MREERVVAFDLSSKCIGVTCAAIKEKDIVLLKTFPIFPKPLHPKELGWLATKQKFVTAHGEKYTSYVTHKDERVTKQEAAKRNVRFRDEQRRLKLREIAETVHEIMTKTKPTVLVIEKNASFNGILTTKQLAEIAGEIHAFAGFLRIPLFEYPVQTIRQRYHVPALLKEFCKNMDPEQLREIEDKNKYVLKLKLLERFKKCGLNPDMTLDESDSLAAFAHWFDFDYGGK